MIDLIKTLFNLKPYNNYSIDLSDKERELKRRLEYIPERYHQYIFLWLKTSKFIVSKNGMIQKLEVGWPATETEIEFVENQLDFQIPPSFRQVLLEFAKSALFEWELHFSKIHPDFPTIFDGFLNWDISKLLELEKERLDWVEHDGNKPGFNMHEKLLFQGANHGWLALDLSHNDRAPVVYLHQVWWEEDTRIIVLGEDFQDFLLKWSFMGCVQRTEFEWFEFIGNDGKYLDLDLESTQKLRKILGT